MCFIILKAIYGINIFKSLKQGSYTQIILEITFCGLIFPNKYIYMYKSLDHKFGIINIIIELNKHHLTIIY